MSEGSAAPCAGTYDAPGVEMEDRIRIMPRWSAIPWARVAMDALLVAGILLASSSLLTVR